MASLYTEETTSGTVTAYFPLTSFATPSSCSNKYSSTKGTDTLFAFPSKATCAPVALSISENQGPVTRNTAQSGHMPTTTLLGPVQCEGVYSTASTSAVGSSRTRVICCPSGYDKYNFVNGTAQCTSTAPSGTKLKVDIYTIKSNGGGNAEVDVTLKNTVTAVALGVQGWNINQGKTTTTATTAPAAVTSPRITPISSGDSSGPSESSYSRTAVGVGVGVGVGGAIILALVAFFLYRRRKRRAADTQPEVQPETAEVSTGPGELQGDNRRPEEVEGSSHWPLELQGSRPGRFELDSGR